MSNSFAIDGHQPILRDFDAILTLICLVMADSFDCVVLMKFSLNNEYGSSLLQSVDLVDIAHLVSGVFSSFSAASV